MDFDKLLKAMFPDSEIAKQFRLRKTKYSCFIHFSKAAIFITSLIKQINTFPFYSFSLAESTNSVMEQCQLDAAIRYWSENAGKEGATISHNILWHNHFFP